MEPRLNEYSIGMKLKREREREREREGLDTKRGGSKRRTNERTKPGRRRDRWWRRGG